ncbi:MAG: hypothetical protein ABWW66_08085 [Archaeoglobaceae archaeon]
MSVEMLRIDYDIQHHLILSRRNLRDHAIVRLIVASLAEREEIVNVRRKDFRRHRGKEFEYYTVVLRSGGKRRVSVVDAKTFEIFQQLPEKPFEIDVSEVDEIVAKYSPEDRKYDAEKLRKAVEMLLRDASFFEIDIEELKNPEDLYAFMLDFNPIYSDVWEVSDEEGFEEFVLNYAKIHGGSAAEISEKIGEDVEKIEKILAKKKKSLLSFAEEL